MSTLTQLVPSLTMEGWGSDTAAVTLQVRLRGLSPNHVLVLIDGKRRHTTANLAVDYGSAFQGSAGADLSFIPLEAIDHIEVLTEGAAAQYGTDAIAGVINIILKKNSSGGRISATYGGYHDGGGDTGDISGNIGFEPADGAYFNVTAEVHNHGHSDRGAIDERVINPANLSTYPGSNMIEAPGYPHLNVLDGDAESHLKLLTFNSGAELGADTEFYAIGTYGHKDSATYENYRPPTVVSYLDPNTGETIYPFPYGFSPQEALQETDYALTAGIKGLISNWRWDLSSTWGADKIDLYTTDSANRVIYANTGSTPTNFYDGNFIATQWTTTLDVNRNFDVGLAGPLGVAFGIESRRESFQIGEGNVASYIDAGSAAFSGYGPTDAGKHTRTNYAGYVDLAARPLDKLRIDAAGRFEHYSDFGNATVGKLTARYDFSPMFAIRGTVSSGFRAPTLAEEFYSATNAGPTNTYVQLPPNSPGARLLGLENGLQPENSMNYSFGFVFRPASNMSATLDLYQITVKNRIVGSANLYGSIYGTLDSAAVDAAIRANGNVIDPEILASGTTGINVFTNGVDTRTQGADLVFNLASDYKFGHVDWSIGATFNDTGVIRIRSTPSQLTGQILFDSTVISDLTTASPKYVVNLGALWTVRKLAVNLREIVYGQSSEWENDDADNPTGNPEYFKTTINVTAITNLDLAYHLAPSLKLSIGANNLFNRYPNKFNSTLLNRYDNFAYGDTQGVIQYPGFSPFGINGQFYYAKATYSF
jgi:iron complex outermembrane receptor protein